LSFCVGQDTLTYLSTRDFSRQETKKADVVDAFLEGIGHVGILFNGLPANGSPLI